MLIKIKHRVKTWFVFVNLQCKCGYDFFSNSNDIRNQKKKQYTRRDVSRLSSKLIGRNSNNNINEIAVCDSKFLSTRRKNKPSATICSRFYTISWIYTEFIRNNWFLTTTQRRKGPKTTLSITLWRKSSGKTPLVIAHYFWTVKNVEKSNTRIVCDL